MSKRKRTGFTLIELLVVVAILAIIAGAIIAAYDGLEEKAAQGVATYDLGALNSTIRTFRVTNGGNYPDEWDSLLHTDDSVLSIMPTKLQGKLGLYNLTPAGVAALNEVGITTVRKVATDLAGTEAIPNRVFDDPPRGVGALVPLADGVGVAAVEGIGQADFGGSTPADSTRLQDIAGLDATTAHVVVAFGIGNNSTLVHGSEVFDARAASLAEAPFYQNVKPGEYGRYVALFHLGSDADASGTVEDGEIFEKARFLTVIDTKGDWYDEELAEFQGTKQ